MAIQLWKSYHRFKGEPKFSASMYRVALNTAITNVRKQKKIIVANQPAAIAANVADDNYNAGEEKKLQQLYTAIEQLG